MGRGELTMELWLDGNFWAHWMRDVCIPEIEWTRLTVLQYMLPSIPDPESEANKTSDEIWYGNMSDSSFEEDSYSLAEYATNQGLEMFDRLNSVRQAASNMATVMLWHLIEQQLLHFHIRQVLLPHEELLVRENPDIKIKIPGKKVRVIKLLSLEELHSRLDSCGCSMNDMSSWPKVNEIKLVANTTKHGLGKSSNKLFKIRPDLFYPSYTTQDNSYDKTQPMLRKKPAAGGDLYVKEKDLLEYFEAAKTFWQQFSMLIEDH